MSTEVMLLAASLSHRWVLAAGIGVERQRLLVMRRQGSCRLFALSSRCPGSHSSPI